MSVPVLFLNARSTETISIVRACGFYNPLFTDSLANTDDLQNTTTSDERYFLFKLMIVEKIDI